MTYENAYVRGHETVAELELGIVCFFNFYNHERPHSALDYRTLSDVYATGRAAG